MTAPPAGVPCHPVAEAQWSMQRSGFLEQRCMEILLAWVWTTGDLDCKLEFGLHAWQDSLHADRFLQRAGELRPALPPYGWEPRPLALAPLDVFCRELAQASDLLQKLSGLYCVLKPWLLASYEQYYATADPILEGPTVQLLEGLIPEERRQIAWGQAMLERRLAAAPESQTEAARWQASLEQRLRD
ncbi:MAG TPA: hypothetical protein VHB98_22875, partial [Chloroflexota bacterium]|nr:hypothetical protein [Chloroflexota bacterium]